MIAAAGDIVTCEGGHECFRLTQDIEVYSPLRAAAFEPIGKQAPIVAGVQVDTSTRCAECGLPTMRQKADGGWQMHVNGGWRP